MVSGRCFFIDWKKNRLPWIYRKKRGVCSWVSEPNKPSIFLLGLCLLLPPFPNQFIDLNPLHRARNIFACFYPVYSHNGKPFDINRTIHHAEAISGSDASKMWRGDMILMSVRHACADNISDMLNANTILDLKQAVLSVCPPVRVRYCEAGTWISNNISLLK